MSEPLSILIADGDIISRHVISDYLRRCGYSVVEAAGLEETYVALNEPTLVIDILLFDVASLGLQPGTDLSEWIGTHRPELEVKLVGGAGVAAQIAAELCKSGPHLKKPYEAEIIISYINSLRAKRLRQVTTPIAHSSLRKPRACRANARQQLLMAHVC